MQIEQFVFDAGELFCGCLIILVRLCGSLFVENNVRSFLSEVDSCGCKDGGGYAKEVHQISNDGQFCHRSVIFCLYVCVEVLQRIVAEH